MNPKIIEVAAKAVWVGIAAAGGMLIKKLPIILKKFPFKK